MCRNESNTEEGPWACIKEKTYSFEELVISAARGGNPSSQTKIPDFQFWNWHMPSPGKGRCYFLNYNVPLGIDMMNDVLFIELDPKKTYYIALYELDFFTYTGNPIAMPVSTFTLPSSELAENNAQYVSLEASKFNRLNRPTAPCNTSASYNFTQCVIESVAKTTGCSPPWQGNVSGSG